MAAFAPTVAKLVQQAVEAFPVVVQRHRIGSSPGIDLFNQRQALRPMLGRLGLDFFQPGLDHLVGFVAGIVKTLPQTVVGHTPLVGLLPLITQRAQALLHLAPTYGLPFRALEQTFGLGYQFLAQLVGTPTLPALQLTRCRQRGMGLVLQLVVDDFAEFLERIAQGASGTGTRLAMSFGNFLL